MHSLHHLHLDAIIHGPLDRISAFGFENYMQTLKRMLRSKHSHLRQIVKRVSEGESFDIVPPTIPHSSTMEITTNGKDNVFLLESSKICYVEKLDGANNCVLKIFSQQKTAKYYPCDSSKLGIYIVNEETLPSMLIPTSDLKKKCILFPFSKGYFCIPLCN